MGTAGVNVRDSCNVGAVVAVKLSARGRFAAGHVERAIEDDQVGKAAAKYATHGSEVGAVISVDVVTGTEMHRAIEVDQAALRNWIGGDGKNVRAVVLVEIVRGAVAGRGDEIKRVIESAAAAETRAIATDIDFSK